MEKRILIDAGHPEETRVVVSNGNHIDEFYFESNLRKPTRGNIYLAKVVRIEPSLQAAFVSYGRDRHGFLAFNDIHPDYYQIPLEDRQALLAEQAEAEAEANARELEEFGETDDAIGENVENDEDAESDDIEERDEDAGGDEGVENTEETEDGFSMSGADESEESEDSQESAADESNGRAHGARESRSRREDRPRRRPMQRKYHLQEVIKNRQILLVQVVKEERGNKGAALTTYLSLAGRYCVLMPNTERGSGISRKITHRAQRKNLRSILSTFELPKGMGLIVRTAGAKRTKTDIRRDYEYLLRLWETIRDLTMKSVAPSVIYEEGDLIKRSIRDLYGKGVSEVIVEGEEGYNDARAFMRMLTPSHVKNVHLYKDKVPLFQKHNVENNLLGLLQPSVRLKSGGSLVIEQTEALTAIDVNSGKATREHNIESTALRTNLEATEEAARQMRLRDLSGLIVIDYIDMMENKNRRTVENKLRDCLKTDRARYQVGSISEFGLLELSRQRMRTGILEGSSQTCPHCRGLGKILSVEAAALRLLRALRAEALSKRGGDMLAKAPRQVALYVLNQKRDSLHEIQEMFGMRVRVEEASDARIDDFAIERVNGGSGKKRSDAGELSYGVDMEEAGASGKKEEGGSSKRRSRRSRGGRGKSKPSENAEVSGAQDGESKNEAESEETKPSKSGRARGGRGRRRKPQSPDSPQEGATDESGASGTPGAEAEDSPQGAVG
ncbi:MAG: Rne/Rng family ribonuclease [Hyphomicrobiales bacterium]|nr:Rne/Rng family ribonuclease [Hyphomicrobiales bacterium]MCY4053022.1 Rne/Rng family ribonuclease [Hyphomicrobiales bacterium]